ncbi:MAG: YbjN domain-containing protein [Bacteroidales bacterium]|nr:YbjN domain-containing protein [Bacteroidales bacterium]
MSKVKDEIFEHLKELGLVPKIDEDGDIVFKYQMMTFLVLIDEDDEFFLRLAIPNIFSVDENNRIDVLEACNRVTLRMKVAKAFITGRDAVWLVAEQLLDKDPNYGDVIPRTIRILMDSRDAFSEEINK